MKCLEIIFYISNLDILNGYIEIMRYMLYCRVIMPEITIIDIADNVGFLIYRSFTLGLIIY
jgi:hypothetical protein